MSWSISSGESKIMDRLLLLLLAGAVEVVLVLVVVVVVVLVAVGVTEFVFPLLSW